MLVCTHILFLCVYLGLAFCVFFVSSQTILFCVACFCCVGLSLFSTKPRDWLGRMSSKWPIQCQVGHKTITHLINQSIYDRLQVTENILPSLIEILHFFSLSM